MDLVAGQGLRVSRVADNGLLPTPNTMEHREIKTPEQIAELKERSPGGYRNLRESVINELLPTPKARDHQAEGYEAGLRRGQPQVGTLVKAIIDGDDRILIPVKMDLLPTVRAAQGDSRNNNIWERDPSKPQNLENALFHVLPTPMSRDYKGDAAPHERDGVVQTDTVERAIFHSGEIELMGTPRTSSANGATAKQVEADAPKSRIEDQVLTTSWGKFEPAIRRWEETIGRPAPAPTKPDGKDGNHRLSSAFTEWMMGLPTGWITDAGLTRTEELKACGNGVVPQQAELALRILLEGVEL
jgi:hypothetical protein